MAIAHQSSQYAAKYYRFIKISRDFLVVGSAEKWIPWLQLGSTIKSKFIKLDGLPGALVMF